MAVGRRARDSHTETAGQAAPDQQIGSRWPSAKNELAARHSANAPQQDQSRQQRQRHGVHAAGVDDDVNSRWQQLNVGHPRQGKEMPTIGLIQRLLRGVVSFLDATKPVLVANRGPPQARNPGSGCAQRGLDQLPELFQPTA